MFFDQTACRKSGLVWGEFVGTVVCVGESCDCGFVWENLVGTMEKCVGTFGHVLENIVRTVAV